MCSKNSHTGSGHEIRVQRRVTLTRINKMINCMQIPDSKQTVQTRPFAPQLQPSRQQSRLHHIRQTHQKCSHFCCRHSFQHRLDCIVVVSVRSHRVATHHGKELSQIFCRWTVGEHVTRVELPVNPFHKFPFSSSSCSQQCLISRCFILPTPLL